MWWVNANIDMAVCVCLTYINANMMNKDLCAVVVGFVSQDIEPEGLCLGQVQICSSVFQCTKMMQKYEQCVQFIVMAALPS